MKAREFNVSTALQIATCVMRRFVSGLIFGLCTTPRLLLLTLTVTFGADLSDAATLQVEVQDRSGQPLDDVVVTISHDHLRVSASATKGAVGHSFVMDQLNLRFVPQVLVVPVNANVNFPNSDSVSHQVYSFSKAKSFQLPLYKGKTHAPISFTKPGLIVLGCNIHDDMVGYIYVTDASWSGQTDSNGHLLVPDIEKGKLVITIWSPLIADPATTLTQLVATIAESEKVVFKLKKALRNAPEPRPRNPDWDY